ncbi:NAD-dependent dehydratase [Candidatus Micrarchaeota archaeon]|nr:MAG: NAD-dependent dehydratase [Candidatus Micrarchaeota archaeon]
MKVLVTGGAGFIGRWTVKRLLERGEEVVVLDDLSNGSGKNLEEFKGKVELIKGNVADGKAVEKLFDERGFGLCVHLAAQINVQKSIDDPVTDFRSNVIGTHNVMEGCRKHKAKSVIVSTCMVYDTAGGVAINEEHPVKPASPYAGSKLAAEEIALSYYHAYKLPVVVLRPFNTYGPYQKSNMEGGVVTIFLQKQMKGEELRVFGSGEQTRDLLYVEDCAEFIETACYSDAAVGQIFNAGSGEDIKIKELANMIAGEKGRVAFVEHHHPQSEIMKLLCDYSKARKLLAWKPRTSLKEGIERTREWLEGGSL